MMRSMTFPKGGIHPPARKRKNHTETINAIIPRTSIVPLLQHVGRPARPTVGAGDRVREGMLIGAADDDGANIHAPIPGIVREIRSIRPIAISAPELTATTSRLSSTSYCCAVSSILPTRLISPKSPREH